MKDIKGISITVAIFSVIVLICYLSVLVFNDNATYLIKQSDIPKIESVKGIHLKVRSVNDFDACNEIKVVTIEADYYFGGKIFTNIPYELTQLGIEYHTYR